MAFWGVEIKPGKPYSHRFDAAQGRLHISKATLGVGTSNKKTSVQCNVGNKSPILLCCLKPDQTDSCSLHIEFAEHEDVVFSVLGSRSVHLAGYYLDKGANFDANDDDSDSYGEDIGETESEQSTDFDSEDEEDAGFILDDSDDDANDEIDMFPSPVRPNSGVVIEEIVDDEKPANEKQMIAGDASGIFDSEDEDGLPIPSRSNSKDERAKIQKQHDGEDEEPDKARSTFLIVDSENEDEDGLLIPSRSNNKDESVKIQKKPDKKRSKKSKMKAEDASDQVPSFSSCLKTNDEEAEVQQKHDKKASKGSKKKAEGGSDQVTGTKRKIQDDQEGETKRGAERLVDSSLPSTEGGQENADKPKKKKKKQQTKEKQSHGVGDGSMVDVQKEDKAHIVEGKTDDITQEEPVRDEADEKPSNKIVEANHAVDGEVTEKKKKKKKNKKNKTPESEGNANTEEGKKGAVVEIEAKKAKVKPTQERSYSNGLVVEELEMGKPDGKRASPGNKVSVHYIGKLKKNGQIFDSNIRNCNAPFQFRLGVGQVIKGWDVGVNGMRVGDKRRITIPPSMGYGSQGAGAKIPPNSWLVFDVELAAVR